MGKITPPKEGWEDHTWYLVDLEAFAGNPRHRSLYYSGFVTGIGGDGGNPGNYNGTVSLNGPDFEDLPLRIQDVHYLRVVRKLFSRKECESKEPVRFIEQAW